MGFSHYLKRKKYKRVLKFYSVKSAYFDDKRKIGKSEEDHFSLEICVFGKY